MRCPPAMTLAALVAACVLVAAAAAPLPGCPPQRSPDEAYLAGREKLDPACLRAAIGGKSRPRSSKSRRLQENDDDYPWTYSQGPIVQKFAGRGVLGPPLNLYDLNMTFFGHPTAIHINRSTGEMFIIDEMSPPSLRMVRNINMGGTVEDGPSWNITTVLRGRINVTDAERNVEIDTPTPGFVVTDGDVIYISDFDRGRIFRADLMGEGRIPSQLEIIANSAGARGLGGECGPATLAQFRYPRGIAILPSNTFQEEGKSLAIADSGNNRIRMFEITDWPGCIQRSNSSIFTTALFIDRSTGGTRANHAFEAASPDKCSFECKYFGTGTYPVKQPTNDWNFTADNLDVLLRTSILSPDSIFEQRYTLDGTVVARVGDKLLGMVRAGTLRRLNATELGDTDLQTFTRIWNPGFSNPTYVFRIEKRSPGNLTFCGGWYWQPNLTASARGGRCFLQPVFDSSSAFNTSVENGVVVYATQSCRPGRIRTLVGGGSPGDSPANVGRYFSHASVPRLETRLLSPRSIIVNSFPMSGASNWEGSPDRTLMIMDTLNQRILGMPLNTHNKYHVAFWLFLGGERASEVAQAEATAHNIQAALRLALEVHHDFEPVRFYDVSGANATGVLDTCSYGQPLPSEGRILGGIDLLCEARSGSLGSMANNCSACIGECMSQYADLAAAQSSWHKCSKREALRACLIAEASCNTVTPANLNQFLGLLNPDEATRLERFCVECTVKDEVSLGDELEREPWTWEQCGMSRADAFSECPYCDGEAFKVLNINYTYLGTGQDLEGTAGGPRNITAKRFEGVAGLRDYDPLLTPQENEARMVALASGNNPVRMLGILFDVDIFSRKDFVRLSRAVQALHADATVRQANGPPTMDDFDSPAAIDSPFLRLNMALRETLGAGDGVLNLNVLISPMDGVVASDPSRSTIASFASKQRVAAGPVYWQAGNPDPLFDQPAAMAFDKAGQLYVANTGSHEVLRIHGLGSPSHGFEKVAGTGTPDFRGNGNFARVTSLNQPTGLDLDKDGVVYVTDSRNHQVRQIMGLTLNNPCPETEWYLRSLNTTSPPPELQRFERSLLCRRQQLRSFALDLIRNCLACNASNTPLNISTLPGDLVCDAQLAELWCTRDVNGSLSQNMASELLDPEIPVDCTGCGRCSETSETAPVGNTSVCESNTELVQKDEVPCYANLLSTDVLSRILDPLGRLSAVATLPVAESISRPLNWRNETMELTTAAPSTILSAIIMANATMRDAMVEAAQQSLCPAISPYSNFALRQLLHLWYLDIIERCVPGGTPVSFRGQAIGGRYYNEESMLPQVLHQISQPSRRISPCSSACDLLHPMRFDSWTQLAVSDPRGCCGYDGHLCGEGEGDCEVDADCSGTLVCGVNNCFGFTGNCCRAWDNGRLPSLMREYSMNEPAA